MRRLAWRWVAWIALAGCVDGDDADPSFAGIEQHIVYGRDDRLDVHESPDPMLREIAKGATVALVNRRNFATSREDGTFAIFARPLEQVFQVCEDERFAAQPTLAECSGVLIDDDLVLTAGHCFATDELCARYAFVFDYFFASQSELEPLSFGDFYGCRRVVKRELSSDQSVVPRIDYAVVQLDRPALGRTPVRLRTSPLEQGEPLSTIGCTSGLPFKIDSGARVLATRDSTLDYFMLDSDTFQGSSGSGVYDSMGALVGVLVRGGDDYEERSDASCKVPKVVSWMDDAGAPPSSPGEEATYLTRAIAGVCNEAGWPSARLCGRAPVCGDGVCNAHESRANCLADCACGGLPCVQSAQRVTSGEAKANRDGCALAQGAPPLGVLAGLLIALTARRRRA